MRFFKYISLCILLLFGSVGYSQNNLISNGTNLLKVGNNILSIVSTSNQHSMVFDGVDEYVNIDNVLTSLTTTTKGTWSYWVKPVDATPSLTNFLISFGDTDGQTRISMFIQSDRTLGALAYDSGTIDWYIDTDNAVFSDNTWIHIVLTQDGIEPILYINSVKPAQTFVGGSLTKTTWFNDLSGLDNGRMANRNWVSAGDTDFFNGNIDEVSFWNTDLSLTEAQEINNAGVPKNLLNHSKSANLVSWFRMGDKGVWDGSNWTFPDQKGSNDGTSVNMEFIDRTNETP